VGGDESGSHTSRATADHDEIEVCHRASSKLLKQVIVFAIAALWVGDVNA
jgi:hypothetical protein